MTMANSENVLKILQAYNKWWDTNVVPKEYLKEYKRQVFHEAFTSFTHTELRRHVVLSGARRTGKTTMMYQTISELLKNGVDSKRILFVSFDHPLLKMFSLENIIEIYHRYICEDENVYLFLDEIQYAESWAQYLKIFYDIAPQKRIMATGSASSAIIRETDESGLGRWRVVPVPTLSFFEYLELSEADTPMLNIQDINPLKMHELSLPKQTEIIMKLDKLFTPFLRYIQVGGFPEIALLKDTTLAARTLREDVIDKAIKKDIPAVYEIRNTNDLEKVFLYLCYHSSNLINIEAVVKELTGINRVTVQKYITYLESANLIYISKAVNLTGKSALKQQDKIYIADSSIRNNLLMNSDILTNPEELGVLAEGVVFRHFKYHFLNDFINVGYFRTDSKGREIDIATHKNNKPHFLAEVKYRESAEIKETDAIVVHTNNNTNYVIAKRSMDFGLHVYPNGKQIYRIPAHAMLYLLGYVESKKLLST